MRDPVLSSALAYLHRRMIDEMNEIKAMIVDLKAIIEAPIEFEVGESEEETDDTEQSEIESSESDTDSDSDALSVKSAPASITLEQDGSLKKLWREHISDLYVNNDGD